MLKKDNRMNKTTIRLYGEVVDLLDRLSKLPKEKFLGDNLEGLYTFKYDNLKSDRTYKICLQNDFASITEVDKKIDLTRFDGLCIMVSSGTPKFETGDFIKIDERLGCMKKSLSVLLVNRVEGRYIETEDELYALVHRYGRNDKHVHN